MIKTMLLTAQLALSPIVGTNGLQPKSLPNPVYGESVDYSVTYNGETYTRVCSGDYYAKNVLDNHEIYWGYVEAENNQAVKSDSLEWIQETNVSKKETDYYIYWGLVEGIYTNTEILLGEKTCLSFWTESPNKLTYTEVFQGQENIVNIWLFAKSEGVYTFERYYSQSVCDGIGIGNNLYTHDPYNILDWGNHPRNIQNYQPSIANPSVYDNIYNFYYQNLFANEALDELGAKVGNNSMTMRQWLAHTATIFSISLLAAALVILVIKIFKLIAGSISDIWG